MRTPFAEEVTSGGWRAQVHLWVEETLAARGVDVLGPLEQVRVRPWSTLMRVPSSLGLLWFKAGAPLTRFEPALAESLARLVPGLTPTPLAVDAERGWMVTTDLGPTLDEQRAPTIDDWCGILAVTATAQRVLASHRPELLATGLPDTSPETVPGRFERLLSLLTAVDEPYPLDGESLMLLERRRGALNQACTVLAASPLPTTWQHGDLHPRNVLLRRGRPVVFDLGDGQWAHAAEVLAVPYGWISEHASISWPDVLDAWREPWGASRAEVDSAWSAVALTHPVNRAATWLRILESATLAERTRWGDQPRRHLLRLLE